MFLTREEIAEFTGYVRPSSQRAWLDRNLIPYYVNGSGRPIVLRSSLEHRTMPGYGAPTNKRLRLAATNVPAR